MADDSFTLEQALEEPESFSLEEAIDSPEPSSSLRAVTEQSQLVSRPSPEPFAVARTSRLSPTLGEAWAQLPPAQQQAAKEEALHAFQQEPLINIPRIETAPDAHPLAQIGAGAINTLTGLPGALTTGEALVSLPAFLIPEVAAPLMTAIAGKTIGESAGALSFDDPSRTLQQTTERVLAPVLPTMFARGAVEALPPSVFGRVPLPRTFAAAMEEPMVEPAPPIEPLKSFMPARVQPGERAGLAIPSAGRLANFPRVPEAEVPEGGAAPVREVARQYPEQPMPVLSKLQTSRNAAAFRRAAKAAQAEERRIEAAPQPSSVAPELHPTSANLIEAILSTAAAKDAPLAQLYGALEAAPTASRILEGHISRLETSGVTGPQLGLFYDALAKIEAFQDAYAEGITKPPTRRGRAKTADVLGKPPPEEPPPAAGGVTVPKQPPAPTGGPSALQESVAETPVRGVPQQPVVREGEVPASESPAGVPRSEQAPEPARGAEVSLTPEEQAAARAQLAEEVPAAQPFTLEEAVMPAPETAKPAEPAPVAVAKAQAEVTRVAATKGKRSAKDVKAELVLRLEQAIKDAPSEKTLASLGPGKREPTVGEMQSKREQQSKVTIEIPGDGTFTVFNTKEALEGLLARAKRISVAATEPVKVTRRAAPKLSGEELEALRVSESPRPGPGAASPSEFSERTASAARGGPPPPNAPVALDASTPPSPEVVRRAKDFHAGNLFTSGQWTFYFGKLGEAAKSAWERMTLADFRIRESIGRDVKQYVDGLLSSLPRPVRKNGAQVFFDALDGKPIDAIEAEWSGKPEGPAVIAAARALKTRLEEIRTTIRDTKREGYHGFLMGLDRATLEQLFQRNISRAVDTARYTKETFADALTRDHLPDDWGIADGSYLPHIFFGNWKVTANHGTSTEFVMRARTPAEAKARIYQHVRDNPDYAKATWKIEPDTVVPADILRLADRRFWHLVSQMKDAFNVSASEVKQAQQGIIGKKSSRQKWFGNLQRREGYSGYSRDYRQVLSAYLSGFHRWVELSKLQREVQPLIDQVRREGRRSAAERLDEILEQLWGKPSQGSVLLDNTLQRIPGLRDRVKPLALDRWSRNVRSAVAFLTLSTPRFAVVNRLQPLQGLYPLVGERIFAQAKIRQHTKEGRALLDAAGVAFDPGQYGFERGLSSGLSRLREKFTGEKSNQELAFLAMYQHGIEQGLPAHEAVNYAKLRGQLLTQFTPSVPDTPPALQGPLASAFFQFKRFPVKQVELLSKMAAEGRYGGLARWLTVMGAIGGANYFLRQFLTSNESRERLRRTITQEHGQAVADAVLYGAPGLLNADLSGSLVLGDEPFGDNIYEKVGRQLGGPFLSLTAEGLNAAVTSAREPSTALQQTMTMLRKFPTLKPIAELIALETGDLDVRTPDGEVKYRKAVRDAVVGLGAFRSARESNLQTAVNAIIELKKEQAELKNSVFVAFTSPAGNVQPALDAVAKFNQRWPEVAISSKELGEYVHTRARAMPKTDYERLAGRKFAPLLPTSP